MVNEDKNSILKVSVVMATFNGQEFIKEQMDSILQQTYPIHEIIISDDGSTDSTKDIILEYCRNNPLIRFTENKGHHGPNGNFKHAILLSEGDIIVPSDQDDIWAINKIEKLVGAFDSNVDLVYAQDLVFSNEADGRHDIYYLPSMHVCVWKNGLKGHTCAFRKELRSLYEESGAVSWDYVLSLYGVITGRAKGIPDELVRWRRHEAAVTMAGNKLTGERLTGLYGRERWSAFLEATRLLMYKKNISDSFRFYTSARSHLLRHIATNEAIPALNRMSVRIYAIVLNYAAKQTWASMLTAGFLNAVAISQSQYFTSLRIRDKLGCLSLNFRTPYIEWLSTKDLKHLA